MRLRLRSNRIYQKREEERQKSQIHTILSTSLETNDLIQHLQYSHCTPPPDIFISGISKTLQKWESVLAVMLSSPVLFLSPKRLEFVTSYVGEFLLREGCAVSFSCHTVFKPEVSCSWLPWNGSEMDWMSQNSRLTQGQSMYFGLIIIVTWRKNNNRHNYME